MIRRTIQSILLCLMVMACTVPPPAAPMSPLAPPPPYRRYLPIIADGRPAPQPSPSPTPTCWENDKANQFYTLLAADARQQRPALRCDRRLVIAAQARAAALIRDGNWAHVDAQGVWANDYARAAGCVLPATYGHGNNIESLVAGSPDTQISFAVLGASPGHAPHLFGQNDFFRAQDRIGIGYAEGGRFGFYWVILIAPCQ